MEVEQSHTSAKNTLNGSYFHFSTCMAKKKMQTFYSNKYFILIATHQDYKTTDSVNKNNTTQLITQIIPLYKTSCDLTVNLC